MKYSIFYIIFFLIGNVNLFAGQIMEKFIIADSTERISVRNVFADNENCYIAVQGAPSWSSDMELFFIDILITDHYGNKKKELCIHDDNVKILLDFKSLDNVNKYFLNSGGYTYDYPRLVTTDKEHNIISDKNLSDSHILNGLEAYITFEDTLFARRYNFDLNQIELFKINHDLEIFDSVKFDQVPDIPKPGLPLNLVVGPHNNIYIPLHQYSDSNIGPDSYPEHTVLAKYSEKGELLLEKKIQLNNDSTFLYDLLFINQNEILVTGNVGTSSGRENIFIVLDNEFNIINIERYPFPNFMTTTYNISYLEKYNSVIYSLSTRDNYPPIRNYFKLFNTSGEILKSIEMKETISGGLISFDEYNGIVYGGSSYYRDTILFSKVEPEYLSVPFLSNIPYISILPNPASDFINISYPEGFIPEGIVLIDILGNEVLRSSITLNKINISSFSPGVYFLRVTSKNIIVNKTVIIL